jgi:N-acetylmuramoyl-L-alanine amidase
LRIALNLSTLNLLYYSMTKKLLLLLTLFISYITFVSLTHPSSPAQKPVLKTIIIDPGHGGKDPGARGLFSNEADVALAISLKLGKAIQEKMPDVKLVYTRTTDVLPGNALNKDLALRIRANMANEAKGDLFISIHCNAVGPKAGGWYAKRVVGYRNKVVYTGKGKKRKKKTVKEPIYENYYVENKRVGTETYIWAADRSEAKSTYINTAEEGGENVEDSLNVLDLNSPEARIRAQLYTKFYFRNSYTFAKFVEDEFAKAGRFSGGVKQRNEKGIWVLQATGMPSILVETGFITNKKEEEYLNSEDGQLEVVSNIMGALERYKKDLETLNKSAVTSSK